MTAKPYLDLGVTVRHTWRRSAARRTLTRQLDRFCKRPTAATSLLLPPESRLLAKCSLRYHARACIAAQRMPLTCGSAVSQVTLEPGEYYVVPHTTGCKFAQYGGKAPETPVPVFDDTRKEFTRGAESALREMFRRLDEDMDGVLDRLRARSVVLPSQLLTLLCCMVPARS